MSTWDDSIMKDNDYPNVYTNEGTSASTLTGLLYGEFVPDERENALYDRLVQYYKDTPDSMNNRDAMVHWKLFKQWCSERGITNDEINRAKKQCAHLAI